jgi:RimJ/RimL family protein N-acetyltransferase
MAAAIAFARALPGVRQVHLCVSSPAAAVLYQRLGFRTWGVEPAAMIVDGTLVDEKHMVLDLREDENLPET